MPNIIDILARALSLRQETALNSITPNRAGGIMYDTLLVLNQMQLEGGSLLISKVYASVSAMEADTTPTSDLTGRALKPGQLVVIVTSDSSSSDMGSEYRFNGPGSWTYVGKVGGLPLDTVPTQSSTKGITSGGVYTALAAMKAEGYKYMGLATPGSGGTAPGTPNQPVFYIAGPGSYPNFGSITVASGYLGFIKYSGGSWSVESVAVGKDYDEEISQLEAKVTDINTEEIQDETEEVAITDDEGNVIVKVTENGVQAKAFFDKDGNEIKADNLPLETHDVVDYSEQIGTTVYTRQSSTPSDPTYQKTVLNCIEAIVENGKIYARQKSNYSTYFNSPNIAICLLLGGLEVGKTYTFTGDFTNCTADPNLQFNVNDKNLGSSISGIEFQLVSGTTGEGKYTITFKAVEPIIGLYIWSKALPSYTADPKLYVENIIFQEVGDEQYAYIETGIIRNLDGGAFSNEFLSKHKELTDIPTFYLGDDIMAFNKCLCIGDSLTAGSINTTDEQGSSGPNVPYDAARSYPSKLAKLTGMDVTTVANGGASIEGWYELHENDDLSGYEMAIIFLGVNNGGTWNQAAETGMRNIITKLRNENSNTGHDGNFLKIFIVNGINLPPYQGYFKNDVVLGLEALVEDYADPDIILLDLKQYGNLCGYAYSCGHPSALGYMQMAQDICRYISWHIHTHPDDFRFIQFIGTDYIYTKIA